MDKTLKILLAAMAALIILTPLGLISTGETFGEWSNEVVEELVGYVPAGLEDLPISWPAPLPDYAVPGLDTTIGTVAGYILSAVIGVVVGGGLLYVIGKALARKESNEP